MGVEFNRRLPEHRGAHGNNTSIANDAICYDADGETWKCRVRRKKVGKYDWVGIINHVNSKRKSIRKEEK